MSSSIPQFQVYGLYDPVTGDLRYIGSTIALLSRRLSHHIAVAKITHDAGPSRHSWIRSLLERGQRPVIRLIAICLNEQEMARREREVIRSSISNGVPLLNKAHNEEIARLYQHKLYAGFISPSGELFTIENMTQFCKERGLSRRDMESVYTGRRFSYRGYRLDGVEFRPATYHKRWSGFIRPDGTPEPPFLNLDGFCKQHGLSRSCMQRLAKGRLRSYRGWTHIGTE